MESPHYAPTPSCLRCHVQSFLCQMEPSILFTALEIIRSAIKNMVVVECRGCLKASSFSNPGTKHQERCSEFWNSHLVVVQISSVLFSSRSYIYATKTLTRSDLPPRLGSFRNVPFQPVFQSSFDLNTILFIHRYHKLNK